MMLTHDATDVSNGFKFTLMDDGHAVANGFDFAQLVRRKENGFAFVLQTLNDFAHFHSAQRIEAAGRLIKTYSKGMQQRVGLAQALINNPDLLILDEPTSGLDPLGRMKVREIIQRLKNEGKTVFFS